MSIETELDLMRNPFIVNIPLRKNKRWCGIYSLYFDDKFYVGRSRDIRARAKQHRYEIMRLTKLDEVPPVHYLYKVMQHIHSKGIRNLDLTVLEECKEAELIEKEQYWLTNYKEDPNCLNVGFIALKSSYEVAVDTFQPISMTMELLLESPRQKKAFEKFVSEFKILQESERSKQC